MMRPHACMIRLLAIAAFAARSQISAKQFFPRPAIVCAEYIIIFFLSQDRDLSISHPPQSFLISFLFQFVKGFGGAQQPGPPLQAATQQNTFLPSSIVPHQSLLKLKIPENDYPEWSSWLSVHSTVCIFFSCHFRCYYTTSMITSRKSRPTHTYTCDHAK